MAKKKKAALTKSALIRKYQAKHRGASAKEVVAALAAQGIDVTEALVYNVKSQSASKKKATRKKSAKKTVVVKKKRTARKKATRSSVSALSANDLFEAKKLVDRMGSLKGARKAIEALEKLR